jgi:hypothetical protein
MNRPANFSHYIKIKTTEPLDKATMKTWFDCAKEFLPGGVIASVQTTDDQGSLRSATMVHREVGGAHEYIIPLSRDLLDKEVQPVIDALASELPDLDFDLEVSSAQAGLLTEPEVIEVADNKYTDLCTAWARKQHETWLHDRTDAGWRYGPSMSVKNKTHPLLRPWHDLPDQFRKIDTSQPQALLDLLNDQGYAVIGKAELEGIMRLLKGGV